MGKEETEEDEKEEDIEEEPEEEEEFELEEKPRVTLNLSRLPHELKCTRPPSKPESWRLKNGASTIEITLKGHFFVHPKADISKRHFGWGTMENTTVQSVQAVWNEAKAMALWPEPSVRPGRRVVSSE